MAARMVIPIKIFFMVILLGKRERLARERLPDEIAYGFTYVVRPDYYGEHSLPEGKAQEAYREKPPDKPKDSRETVLFYFYFLHGNSIPFLNEAGQ
jgi:hypothetical protein